MEWDFKGCSLLPPLAYTKTKAAENEDVENVYCSLLAKM
jgi:hypothetical protein